MRLTRNDLEQIRAIVREELERALRGGEQPTGDDECDEPADSLWVEGVG